MVLALTNPDPLKYSWWLASRAAGITAFLFITLSTILGLVMASGIIRKKGIKAKLMPAHEYMALFALLALAVHGLTLLGDKWLKTSFAGITVPGVIGYRPFWVAIGIVAGYITALLALSFYGRKYVGVKRWRKLHRLIVVVWVMGVAHSLGAGTDAGTAWFRILIIASVAPALFLTLYRWLPEDNRDRDITAPGTNGETVIIHPHEHETPPPSRSAEKSPQVTIPAPSSSSSAGRERVTIPAPTGNSTGRSGRSR